MYYIIGALVVLYILSALGTYKFIQKAHSKGGRWYGLATNGTDVAIVFTPILNSIGAIDFLARGYLPDSENKRDLKDYGNFFRIKI